MLIHNGLHTVKQARLSGLLEHTSSSNAEACSTLRGKPSRRMPAFPSAREASIASLRSIMDKSAGTTTDSFMLSSMNSPKIDPDWERSVRRRSPSERCPRLNSFAARAHWVPLPTPGPPSDGQDGPLLLTIKSVLNSPMTNMMQGAASRLALFASHSLRVLSAIVDSQGSVICLVRYLKLSTGISPRYRLS